MKTRQPFCSSAGKIQYLQICEFRLSPSYHYQSRCYGVNCRCMASFFSSGRLTKLIRGDKIDHKMFSYTGDLYFILSRDQGFMASANYSFRLAVVQTFMFLISDKEASIPPFTVLSLYPNFVFSLSKWIQGDGISHEIMSGVFKVAHSSPVRSHAVARASHAFVPKSHSNAQFPKRKPSRNPCIYLHLRTNVYKQTKEKLMSKCDFVIIIPEFNLLYSYVHSWNEIHVVFSVDEMLVLFYFNFFSRNISLKIESVSVINFQKKV